MNFIKTAQTNDLNPGSKMKVTIEDKVILIANIGGSFYAIDNKCPHLGGPSLAAIWTAKTSSAPGTVLFSV